MKDTVQKQATKYKSKSGVKGPSKKLLNSYLIEDRAELEQSEGCNHLTCSRQTDKKDWHHRICFGEGENYERKKERKNRW